MHTIWNSMLSYIIRARECTAHRQAISTLKWNKKTRRYKEKKHCLNIAFNAIFSLPLVTNASRRHIDKIQKNKTNVILHTHWLNMEKEEEEEGIKHTLNNRVRVWWYGRWANLPTPFDSVAYIQRLLTHCYFIFRTFAELISIFSFNFVSSHCLLFKSSRLATSNVYISATRW